MLPKVHIQVSLMLKVHLQVNGNCYYERYQWACNRIEILNPVNSKNGTKTGLKFGIACPIDFKAIVIGFTNAPISFNWNVSKSSKIFKVFVWFCRNKPFLWVKKINFHVNTDYSMKMSFIMPIKGQRQQTHLSSFKMFPCEHRKKKLMYKTLLERERYFS